MGLIDPTIWYEVRCSTCDGLLGYVAGGCPLPLLVCSDCKEREEREEREPQERDE